MKKLLTLAAAALMAVSLAGCGGEKNENKLVVGTQDMNGDFVEGVTNNSYDADVRKLLHGYNPVDVDNDGNLIWETKVTLDGDPKIEENKDGSKTFTLKLQKGLKWNDGEPVTADDYVFNFVLRASNGWTKAGCNPSGIEIAGFDKFNEGKTDVLAGVKKIDDLTFAVTISKENLPYYWEKKFVMGEPLPKHALAKDVNLEATDEGTKVNKKALADVAVNVKNDYIKNPTVTCGAYNFKGYKNKQVQLEANKEYAGDWKGKKPAIEKIVMKTLDADKDADTLVAGEVDMIFGVVEAEKIDKVKEKGDAYTVVHYPRNGYGTMPLSCYYGATKDVNVRHAIAYLINTDGISNAAMKGYGYTCYSDYGPAQKVYQKNKEWVKKELNPYTFSIDKANEALDKSAYRFEKDGATPFDSSKASADYLRYNDKGEALTISHIGTDKNPITDNIKLQLTKNAPLVGMKYEITVKDFATMIKCYSEKQKADVQYNVYNMATAYTEVPDPHDEVHGKYAEYPNYNPSGINDDQLNKIVEKLRASASTEEYEANWKEYQKRWNYLLPVIPTYTNDYYDFAASKVKGFKTSPFRNWAKNICNFTIE